MLTNEFYKVTTKIFNSSDVCLQNVGACISVPPHFINKGLFEKKKTEILENLSGRGFKTNKNFVILGLGLGHFKMKLKDLTYCKNIWKYVYYTFCDTGKPKMSNYFKHKIRQLTGPEFYVFFFYWTNFYSVNVSCRIKLEAP